MNGVILVPKAGSRLMRVIAFLLRLIGNSEFMERYWTTIGSRIYYPTSVARPELHTEIIRHEAVHVKQWRRFGPLLWLTYLLLPLPFGFAWFRWRWEREAYLGDIRTGAATVDQVVAVLGSAAYGWAWPKPWMREWFRKELAR